MKLVRRSVVVYAAVLAGVAGWTLSAYAQDKPVQKTVVKTADDLPRHTYTIEGKPSEFITSDKPFMEFLAKVKGDAEDDLAKYQIDDPKALQQYYQLQQQIAVIEKRYDDAIASIEKSRALETKESRKLMSGRVFEVWWDAKKRVRGGDEAVLNAFKTGLYDRVKAMPWDVVREEVMQARAGAQMMTRELVTGGLQAQLDPVVAQANGQLSNDLAMAMIRGRVFFDFMLPLMPAINEAYSKLIDEHTTATKDIWSARQEPLTEKDTATPVVVCIWDSGVDVSLFSSLLWVNTAETVNAKDDDANGFVDDINGIAWDLDARPTTSLLHPIDALKADRKLVVSHMKGMLDLQAAVDSPEAAELRTYITALKADKVNDFMEDLGLFGDYAHGTHVAGIAAAGNPFCRLLPIRITFDYHTIPLEAPSVELSRRTAKSYADSVAYMKKAGVRVVNMSWGGSKKEIEEALEKKGVGKTVDERAEMARSMFAIEREGLETAMKSAPGILFVAAAGNSDNNNEFAEFIPSGLNLPNLITVGAVDQGGKPTGFTTFGKNVKLYANGFEVESYIPGGQRLRFSGTSMASPNVANLAAKLIALDPKLTPTQTVELMAKHADPMEGHPDLLIINPHTSIVSLRK